MSATRLSSHLMRATAATWRRTDPAQHTRQISSLGHAATSRPRVFPRICRHSSSSLPPTSLFPLSPPCHRSYSTLPVLEHHVPRQYPFPLILTTELLVEEDLDLQHLQPHDLPPYKSTLTVNLQDLPLTAGEKRIFRHLVGPRMFSATFKGHPIPSWLQRKAQWSARGRRNVNEVKFVSRHLPSAEANENRVFQLLDECVRMSKALAVEMETDGEWVEMGEEELTLLEAKKTLQRELWEERQKKRRLHTAPAAVQQSDAAPQLTGDSAGKGREAREKVAVPQQQRTGE